jgi:hypothetical protein
MEDIIQNKQENKPKKEDLWKMDDHYSFFQVVASNIIN